MSEAPNHRRLLVCAGAVLALALGAGVWSTSQPRFSTDSFRYALVADQIAQGRGARTPVFWLLDPETPSPDEQGTIPFTLQPPGFPYLLAAVGNVGPERTGPARALNLLAHLATCLCCFWLALRLDGLVAATAASCLAAVAFPSLRLNELVLSEPIFSPLFVGAVASLVAARRRASDAERRDWPWLLGAGALAGVAISFRFAGMALFATFAWEAARTWRRAGGRASARSLALTSALPGLVLLLVLAPAMTGRDGLFPHLVTDSLYERPAHNAVWAALRTAGFQIALTHVPPWLAVLAAAVPGGLLGLRAWRTRGEETASPHPRVWTAGLDHVALAGASYIAVLALSLRRLPTLDWRYGAPLVPLGLVLVGVLVARGWRGVSDRRVARGGVIVSLAVLGLTALGAAANLQPSPRRYRVQEGPLTTWLLANVPESTLLASNTPGVVAYFTRRPCMGLPNLAYNPPLPDDPADWLPRTMRREQARYLVLTGAGLDPQVWGAHVGALSRGAPAPPFEVAWSGPDGVVYRLVD